MNAMPLIYVVAGSPAAGKTSFVQQALKANIFPKEAFVHDCDAVMSELTGYQADLKQFGPAAAYHNWEIAAREKAETSLSCAIEAKKSIIYDRSCSLISSYAFLKNLVKMQGYQLIMHALHVDIPQALARASQREKETGRHMPPELLRERLEMFSALWPYYLPLAEQAFLYDNNKTTPHLMACYSCNQLEIRDNILYQNFINQGRGQFQKVNELLSDNLPLADAKHH